MTLCRGNKAEDYSVYACVCVCVRACMRACVCVHVHTYMSVFVSHVAFALLKLIFITITQIYMETTYQ